jgi:hypothetical protein
VNQVVIANRLVYVGGVLLAGWVAVVGLLFPRSVELAVPWHLPPLHAQVIGAFYLSGAVFLAAMARGSTWSRESVVVPMIAVWTGGLLVVLFVHWDRVQSAGTTVAIWLVAYAVLPVTEVRRLWEHRRAPVTAGPPAPRWLRGFLAASGVILSAVAVLLVVDPPAWPWATPPAQLFVLHVYAPPLAAFGTGFLLSARRPLDDLAIVLPASALFAGTVLAVSALRLELFLPGTATVVWFTGFAVVFAGLTAGTIAGVAGRRTQAPLDGRGTRAA